MGKRLSKEPPQPRAVLPFWYEITDGKLTNGSMDLSVPIERLHICAQATEEINERNQKWYEAEMAKYGI